MWKGTILEESLKNLNLLDMVDVVETERLGLENSEEEVRVHKFKLNDGRKSEFVKEAENSLKEGWYLHLVKGNEMVVVYKGKHFRFKRDEREKLEKARQYGLSINIPKEQLGFEKLFRNPYG